jgi:hypothetical protein
MTLYNLECDRCDEMTTHRESGAGRSKADLPEDGVSLTEYIENQLKERRGELAREIADGLYESQVEGHGLPESEELSGFPPNY